MQSSPPQRATNGPPSPATSNYSINLDALELDSHSGASTPLPTRQIDRVLSSDIDGPSDFTLNMEKWMRGGTLKRKGLESLKERKEDAVAPEKTREDMEATESHHTPTNSPPKQSIVGDEGVDMEERDIDDGEEEWEPYAETTSPPTAKKDKPKESLQPTVEEYYSELTPAKFAYSRARRFSKEQDQTLHEDDAIASPGALSSPFDSPARSPVSQHPTPHFNRSQHVALDEELEQLRARCTHLENLNKTLSQTIISERLQRETDTAAHEAQIADFLRREQDLEDMKNQSQQHSSDFRQEFAALKEKLKGYESQQSNHRFELERLKQAHMAEVSDLKSQLETQRSEHEDEVQTLEQDVELARRSRDDAEDAATTAQERLQNIEKEMQDAAQNAKVELDGKESEVEKLKAEIEQGEELREGIKEQLRTKMMEVERLASEKRDAEGATRKIEVDRMEVEGVAEGFRKEVEELKVQLESERDRVLAANDAAELRAEDDGHELRADYNDAIIERDAIQDELDALKAQLAEEKAGRHREREAAKAVGDAFNARIAGAIRTREQYWRARVIAKEEERKVMAKALLRAWGREEVSAPDTLPGLKTSRDDESYDWADRVGGEEQEYRYLFSHERKSGSGDPDAKGDNVIEVLEILDKERVQREGDRRVVLDLP